MLTACIISAMGGLLVGLLVLLGVVRYLGSLA